MLRAFFSILPNTQDKGQSVELKDNKFKPDKRK